MDIRTQGSYSIISESFIVIGLAVFDKSAINVSVIIIITISIKQNLGLKNVGLPKNVVYGNDSR